MGSPSGVQIRHFQATTPSVNNINRLISYNVSPWHVLCSNANRVYLLVRHHTRSSANLNQQNLTASYGAALDRFDQATILRAAQSRKDRLHTTTPDRHRCRPSPYDDTPSDRMRPRRTDRQRTISCTGRSHRVSRMESGSRRLSHCLFCPLRPAITRSTG